jgi:hypothetical protein
MFERLEGFSGGVVHLDLFIDFIPRSAFRRLGAFPQGGRGNY